MKIDTTEYLSLVVVDGKIISYLKPAKAGEDEDEKKLLRYLLRKEKVCPLDKQEMYELQELIQKYGKSGA